MKFEQVLACVFSSFSSLHFGTILSSYIWYWTIKQEFKLIILLHSVLGGCDINIHSLAPSFLTPCLYQVSLCFAFKPVLIHFGIYCVKYWKYFSQTFGHMMASLKNRSFVRCTQCGLLLAVHLLLVHYVVPSETSLCRHWLFSVITGSDGIPKNALNQIMPVFMNFNLSLAHAPLSPWLSPAPVILEAK